jgi:MFS transporter, MHS family, proline/betaine transporter
MMKTAIERPLMDGQYSGNSMETTDKVQRHNSGSRAVVAATVGCMLEWYDFAVYGYFAVVIARVFFPLQSEALSLLLTVATFGVGFAMRPIGALVFGTMADRRGRRVALSWTVAAMVLGTAIIAFTPAYASIGIVAPILVVIARLIQGFSAGGEMGSALSYLTEYAPENRKALYASFQQLTQVLALLCGSLIGAIVNLELSATQVEAWGWRIPFFLGLLIGPVGWYIRQKTEEPPAFAAALARRNEAASQGQVQSAPSAWLAIRRFPRETLAGFCITILWTVCTYYFLVFMPTYAIKQLHLPASVSLLSNSSGLLVAALAIPCFAALSDRVGPRILLCLSSVAILLCSYPALLVLTHYKTVTSLVVIQSGFALLIAAFTGPAGGALAELFPEDIRSTGISISYNFAVTLFGGFAPFIATWLITSTGNVLAPSYYVTFAALAAIIGVALLRNHPNK